MKKNSNKAKAKINKIIFFQASKSRFFKCKLMIINKANQTAWRKEVITCLKTNLSLASNNRNNNPKIEKVPINDKNKLISKNTKAQNPPVKGSKK